MKSLDRVRQVRRFLFAVLAVAAAGGASAGAQEEPTAPEWFLADMAAMTRNGGRWTADNSMRRSAEEPYDAYVIEWRASPDGASMTGRLFGVSSGRETADFWQLRQFWHPTERRAYVMQWGSGGMFGVGVLTPMGDNWGMLEQTFHVLDGRTFRIGHIYRDVGPDERVTEQYDILPDDGVWRLDHSLTFRRARRAR